MNEDEICTLIGRLVLENALLQKQLREAREAAAQAHAENRAEDAYES